MFKCENTDCDLGMECIQKMHVLKLGPNTSSVQRWGLWDHGRADKSNGY